MNKHAKIIRQRAKVWEDKGKRCYNDDGLARAYFADARDLVMVARLIEQGKPAVAYQVAWLLDTIVRDLIPSEQWNYMGKAK